jgi:alpha-L-rhamnosidase
MAMALRGEEGVDWGGAQWISAAVSSVTDDGFVVVERGDVGYQSMRLRRELGVRAGLRRATIRVCGLGHYELTIDGRKVGEDLFTPGWTNYRKTCLYDNYDVTAHLERPGRHALGLLLGNGMYHIDDTTRYTKFTGSFGPLKAIARLHLEYRVGPPEVVATDATWRLSAGPITFSHIFGGEDYDARLESPGWDSPQFAAAAPWTAAAATWTAAAATWTAAAVVDGPGGRLRGASVAAPPIRAIETLTLTSVAALRDGVVVYDLGQNASMMPRVRVSGAAGATVRIIPGELLASDGAVDRSSCGGGMAYWQYTLSGGGCESYFPKFWYHGARYLQVECVAAEPGAARPVVEGLESVIVHSVCEPVGEFACSNGLLNGAYGLIRWAQRSNMWSYMTDCPHRERLGWLEQTHLNGPALRYNFRLDQLFAKTMHDMAETQQADGMVTTTAPEFAVFDGLFRNSPEWSSAFLLIAWQQYEFTGDLELLRLYYDDMARYVEYLASRAEDWIVSFGLSDWYDIGPGEPGYSKLTPNGVTGTAFYYQDTRILAQAAALLGRGGDAARLLEQAERIRGAFNARFFDAETGQYATGSQCANAMAIVMGLVDAEHRAAVLRNVVADVEAKGLTAGDVGFRYLLRALADGDRSDVIYAMINQSATPGYGMMLAKGATALTEAWDANPRSSQNHFMLGQISEWFFHDLAGIQSDPDGPGFRKVILKPTVVGDLTWVKASYKSPHGTIVSEWQRSDATGETTFTATIPANTTATVLLPTSALNSAVTSSTPSDNAVKFLKVEGGYTIYELTAAGTFSFTLVPNT